MTRPVWAGRLPGGLNPDAWAFLHSLPHDRFLWPFDIDGTRAHVAGLEAAGVLKASEAKRLRRELAKMRDHPELIEDTDEDVHSAIERVLTERLGELGAKVHAGRSRNDQVATALRLWARASMREVGAAVLDLIDVLLVRAEEHAAAIAPGYTHLQRAQPITLGHWLCAHAWTLLRDAERVSAAAATADVSPLGAGALATSTLGIDPSVAAGELGFASVFENSLDAVSDRDFLADAAYACATTMTHLSRLGEEIVLWSTTEFGFVRLPDDFATGSSMMPQKANPDVAELVRGLSGQAVGALTGLLVTLKGLPLAYDRDLQADKQQVRAAVEATAGALRAMRGLMAGIDFDTERLAAAADDEALLATDIAEELVRRGVPFRQAHERVAALTRTATARGTTLSGVLDRAAPPPLTPDEVRALLDAKASLRRRSTRGGPGPRSVRAQIRRARRASERHRRVFAPTGSR
jgi:argininosuccinate lyase